MTDRLSGHDFVRSIIEFSREDAAEIFLRTAIDECDWLELKASFYVSPEDPDFGNRKLLARKPPEFDDRTWLNELNKGRIVKDIVSLYNSRGGVVLLGLRPDAGHAPIPVHELIPPELRYRGLNDLVNQIGKELAARHFWFGSARHYLARPLSEMYEPEILPYRHGCVVALVVRAAAQDRSCAIICDDERSPRNASSYLVFRDERQLGNNREEDITGITARQKDRIEAALLSIRRRDDLSLAYERITGSEPRPLDPPQETWRTVWHKLWTFSFKGRATRRELWMSYGYYCLFILASICLSMVFGSSRIQQIAQMLGFVLLAPPFVRRLHDLGLSGWTLLLLFALGMFDAYFPGLVVAGRVANGFFFLFQLSLGVFPGRRIYGKYRGGVFCVVLFALFLLAGMANAPRARQIVNQDAPFDEEEDSEVDGNAAIAYGLGAVGNEYGSLVDRSVLPALKGRRKSAPALTREAIERLSEGVRRVGYLARNLKAHPEQGIPPPDDVLDNGLRDLIAALGAAEKAAAREPWEPSEVGRAFLEVERHVDNVFRRIDVLMKQNLPNPLPGLVHRLCAALNQAQADARGP